MKNYTKEEITKIVSNASNTVLSNNMETFITNAKESVSGKNDNDAIIEMFVLIYHEAQKNCMDTMIEVLNKIMND